MEKLIITLTESINFKLQEVQELTKMINLVATKDVKAMRRFIHSQDTYEKETFFEMLSLFDVEFFHNVYPYSEVAPDRSYAVSIVAKQFEEDKIQERKMGLDIGHCYPEDWSDAEYPDIVEEANRLSVAFA